MAKSVKTSKNLKAKQNSSRVVKKAKVVKTDVRLRQKPKYKSFRLHKQVKHHDPPIISSFQLVKKTFRLFGQNKLNLAVFTIVYGILFLLFVRGVYNPININDLRFDIESAAGGSDLVSTFASNRLIFGQLVGTLSSGITGNQGVYQVMLFVLGALAAIWLFRQQQAGNKVSVKQAFYRGMYPLIPFTLIVYVILIQLLPGVIGNFLYSTVINNGIAVGPVEEFIWLILYLSLLLFSFYLISSSIIALMVVTLPDMTPILALRKAKELVTFRRFAVFRKTVTLFVYIALAFIVIVFPALYLNAVVAQISFLLLSILVLPFSVGYIFVLYRELL